MPINRLEGGFSRYEKNNFTVHFRSLGFSYICENEFKLDKFRLSLALAATLIDKIKIELGRECKISISPTGSDQKISTLRRYFFQVNQVIPILERAKQLISVKSTKYSQLEVIIDKLNLIRAYLIFLDITHLHKLSGITKYSYSNDHREQDLFSGFWQLDNEPKNS
ncbi:MAG: hypothetical protein OHK0017_08960 [Patescibacteria group bacterium]